MIVSGVLPVPFIVVEIVIVVFYTLQVAAYAQVDGESSTPVETVAHGSLPQETAVGGQSPAQTHVGVGGKTAELQVGAHIGEYRKVKLEV